MAQEKESSPRDFGVITSILKEMGINEYEPKVVNQLLEFTYRYVTTVLEDARIYSQYADKKTITVDDVKMAIQSQSEKMLTLPPPQDFLMEIARTRNNQPLPPIRSIVGPCLPPDRYSLISCNYHSKKRKF
ncbi:transcription initiation factor TFIID subunit 9B [Tetranychus urticae]|uniref:Transcription initiation factor TFIID subunit 9 n=1 Tax=Tetranychus urticae TaxID=32264 RepID=T1KVK8_TETUR|nr:transcription initiation factor TFIID subunit 9B [Tetranychus urticae]